jgi:hypothetical protein
MVGWIILLVFYLLKSKSENRVILSIAYPHLPCLVWRYFYFSRVLARVTILFCTIIYMCESLKVSPWQNRILKCLCHQYFCLLWCGVSCRAVDSISSVVAISIWCEREPGFELKGKRICFDPSTRLFAGLFLARSMYPFVWKQICHARLSLSLFRPACHDPGWSLPVSSRVAPNCTDWLLMV